MHFVGGFVFLKTDHLTGASEMQVMPTTIHVTSITTAQDLQAVTFVQRFTALFPHFALKQTHSSIGQHLTARQILLKTANATATKADLWASSGKFSAFFGNFSVRKNKSVIAVFCIGKEQTAVISLPFFFIIFLLYITDKRQDSF